MSAIPQGAIRFNTDSQKLEFYAQDQWWEMVTDTPNLGRGSDSTPGARGVFGGGNNEAGTRTAAIVYVNIASTGNAVSFGNLTVTRNTLRSCSSSTRGLWAGGFTPTASNTIDYVTISSTGDAIDFGDLSSSLTPASGTALSNATRGIFAGGNVPARNNVIEYVTIATTGNSIDFGDLSAIKSNLGALASPVRGVFAGGYIAPASINVIEYIAIATLGNTQDFGDLTKTTTNLSGCSNAIRGVFAGQQNGNSNVIEYITISTLGNAVKFGELTLARELLSNMACSSSTRGVFMGGDTPSPTLSQNVIDYVTIMTQGNAVDFGDLIARTAAGSCCSNAHGGL